MNETNEIKPKTVNTCGDWTEVAPDEWRSGLRSIHIFHDRGGSIVVRDYAGGASYSMFGGGATAVQVPLAVIKSLLASAPEPGEDV